MQKHLKSITFSEEVNNIPKDFTLEFNTTATLLVGENGCGKTTILDGFRGYFNIDILMKPRAKKVTTIDTNYEKSEVVFYDAHAMDLKFAGVFGDDMNTQIRAMQSSSGLGMLAQMQSQKIWSSEDKLILLDEPCRGLSIRMCNMIAKGLINRVLNYNCHLVMSTHSQDIMFLSKAFPEYFSLYSVEQKTYMTYNDFVDSQQKPL